MNAADSEPKYPQFTPGPLVDALPKLNSLYVETRFHRQTQKTLRMLFRAASIPQTTRLTLAIIGPTGSGKTAALRQTTAWLHSSIGLPPGAPDPLSITVLSANTRPKEILAKLLVDGGDPLSAVGPQHHLERRLAKLGPHFKPHGLALDELHHGFDNKSPRDVSLMASTLKNIVNHVPRPIVVMGVDELDTFLDSNDELRMRFGRRVYLADPVIQRSEDIEDIRRLLAAMAEVVPCAKDCRLDSKEMLVRLLVASENRFGAIVDLVKTACLIGADDVSSVLRLADLSTAFNLSTNLKKRTTVGDPFAIPFTEAMLLAKQSGQLVMRSDSAKVG